MVRNPRAIIQGDTVKSKRRLLAPVIQNVVRFFFVFDRIALIKIIVRTREELPKTLIIFGTNFENGELTLHMCNFVSFRNEMRAHYRFFSVI